MSYTYRKQYKTAKEELEKEVKYFKELSDAFPDSEIIKKKVENIFKIHEDILEMADMEIVDLEDQISDLEDDNKDLDNKVTDLEVEVEDLEDKIPKNETLEDHFKKELLEQLSQKYSLVQLTEALKPLL